MKKFLAGLLCVLFGSTGLAQQLTIQITGHDTATPIAIVPFEWTGFGTLPENIPAIITSDLQNSGYFSPVPEKSMLSTPHQEKDVYYRDWRFLGADYLLVGKISRSANSSLIQAQYELFDVVHEKRLIGEVISGTDAQLRDIAHQISDVVFEKITGIRGVFSTKILYITSQRKSQTLTLYQLNLADADGARAQVLLNSQEPIMSPTWSPDGKQIAYVSFDNGSRSQIFIQNLATGAREQITKFSGTNSAPSWSPDGSKMAMVLSKDGSQNVYVMDMRTRELRKITQNLNSADTEPSWTPDGKSLIYTSGASGLFQPQIYQINLETLFQERLTYEGRYNAKASMLPDGKNMVLIHRNESGEDHVSVMNLERGRFTELTNTSLDESPTVAPNGNMIMYSSKSGERNILNAVSINGRITYQLPVKEGDVREPAWSPFRN